MRTENLTVVTEFILMGLSNHRKTQVALFFVVLLIYVLTLVGNLVIITLVRANSNLHTPMYFFLTHLSGLEICYVTSTLPQMLAHLLSGNGAISFPCCIIQMYIAMSLGVTECLLLSAMAYDRFLAICHPMVYAVAMSRWRQLLLASVSWAGGFFLTMINVVQILQFPFCGSNRIDHFFCEFAVLMKLACGDRRITEAILFVEDVLALVVPLSVILTSYGHILAAVLRMQSTSGRHKAFSTCASHLVVVTMFYGTIISVYMTPRSGTSSDYEKQSSVFFVVITPLLNPIIYTLRNKDIHRAAIKMLQRRGPEGKF